MKTKAEIQQIIKELNKAFEEIMSKHETDVYDKANDVDGIFIVRFRPDNTHAMTSLGHIHPISIISSVAEAVANPTGEHNSERDYIA
jgi:hypothetical protein